jgi:hypothetical protein
MRHVMEGITTMGPFEVFNVTAADTLGDIAIEELLRKFAPSLEIRQPIPGNASAYSIEKARRMFGYEPAHSWRDASEAVSHA